MFLRFFYAGKKNGTLLIFGHDKGHESELLPIRIIKTSAVMNLNFLRQCDKVFPFVSALLVYCSAAGYSELSLGS